MRVAAIAALGCLGMATAAHATPGDTLYTRDSTVNVHEAPSVSAPVVIQWVAVASWSRSSDRGHG